MCSCFRFVQYILSVLILLCCATFVLCGVVNFWWVEDLQIVTKNEGLWKSCKTSIMGTACHKRKDIFEFNSNHVAGTELGNINKDIVLVSLIAATVMSLFHLITVAVTMCQRYPSKMTILFGTIFLFFGMVAAIFGTIWALVKISSDNQGWAFYALYGGDGLSVLSLVFSIVLLCTRAPGAYHHTNKDDEIAMLAR